jgi:hypothetical protein
MWWTLTGVIELPMTNPTTTAFNAMRLHALQDKAVADHLLEHDERNRDMAYEVGPPACGRIKAQQLTIV